MNSALTLQETLSHINAEWPDISDKENCARWITRNEHVKTLDDLCCFWWRHEHDY